MAYLGVETGAPVPSSTVSFLLRSIATECAAPLARGRSAADLPQNIEPDGNSSSRSLSGPAEESGGELKTVTPIEEFQDVRITDDKRGDISAPVFENYDFDSSV
jgi:hypothetical protein